MKKYLLLLLLSFNLTNLSIAEEFSPYIQVANSYKGANRQYSGVVFSEDTDNYYVLTCWHGVDALANHQINLHSNVLANDGPLNYVAMRSKIIKSDVDKDLTVLSFAKIEMVKIPIIKILDTDLPKGTKLISYGYSGDFNLINNPVTINSYNHYKSIGGTRILYCDGVPISGMSGGPLIFENQICGIQSAGDNKVLYCPAKEIIEFLRK